MKHLIHIASGAPVQVGHAIFDRRTGEKHIITALEMRSRYFNYVGYVKADGNYAEISYGDAGIADKYPHREALYEGSDNDVQYAGLNFKVSFPYDDDGSAPWERGDGYGIVSDWTSRDKRPGEVRISSDRGSYRYYDWAGSIAKAKAEGWDAAPYGTGTKGEQAVRAVKADFEFLRGWCNDEWRFVIVKVTCTDDEGDELAEDICGGFETFKDYHEEAAWEMIEQMAETVRENLARAAAAEAEAAEIAAAERVELQAIAQELWGDIHSYFGGVIEPAEARAEARADFNRILTRAGLDPV